jgi:hypothetical protein
MGNPRRMPRTISLPLKAQATIASQDGVAALAQLAQFGLDRGFVHRRTRSGRWQHVHPGVVLTSGGQPTRRQRLIAACVWAGEDAVIDAEDACNWYGLRPEWFQPDVVHVVVPATSGRRSRHGVVVRRSFAEIAVGDRGAVPYVDRATAVLAAGRGASSSDTAIAFLSRSLQTGLVTVDQLTMARERFGDKWCNQVDRALVAVGAGARSPAERDAHALFRRSRLLAAPVLNAWLTLGDGGGPVCVDALWETAGMVNEVNGRRYHAFGEQFERTEARRARLVAAGLVVMSCTPLQIRRAAPEVLERLERAFAANHGRGMPAGVAIVDPPNAPGNRALVRF